MTKRETALVTEALVAYRLLVADRMGGPKALADGRPLADWFVDLECRALADASRRLDQPLYDY